MRLAGACSDPDFVGRIVKVLVTGTPPDDVPEYVWANVRKERLDFDPEKPVEVIIRNVEG